MSDTPRTDALDAELDCDAGTSKAETRLLDHARTLERENARLRGALRPFAALMKAAESVHPVGSWRFVAMSSSKGERLEITHAQVSEAKAALEDK